MTDIKDLINTIILGDALEVLKTFPDNSIDTIITDPPYGLGFMNKEWDNPDKERELIEREIRRSEQRFKEGKSPTTAPFTHCVRPGLGIKKVNNEWFQKWVQEWAVELLRVAKPGTILLCFGGTRTFHRLACGIEDAGWEIRDTLMWLYGSGFPKSLNIGKAVDKLQGNKREVISSYKVPDIRGDAYGTMNEKQGGSYKNIEVNKTKGTSEWEGYGTALKPAYEPIIMAMKPLDGTFAENALKWGVAGLNIEGARIPTDENITIGFMKTNREKGLHSANYMGETDKRVIDWEQSSQGRFPANLLLDEVSAEMLDEQSGISQSHSIGKGSPNGVPKNQLITIGGGQANVEYLDLGGASRFFYVAKASKSERNAGCEELEEKHIDIQQPHNSKDLEERYAMTSKNFHPTVKPLKLMDYLVKLTKMPNPNQVYLDPFAGSGSTLIAVLNNDRHFIGIKKEAEYVEIAKARIKYWSERKDKTLDFGEK